MRTLSALLLTCIVYCFLSCQPKEPIPEKIEFGVEVLNPSATEVVIQQLLPKIEKAQGLQAVGDTLTLDTNNWVKIESETWPDGYYQFTYNQRAWQVYLKKGKTLYAQIDGTDEEKPIEFQGGLKKVANYLKNRNEVVKEMLRETRSAYGENETDFIAFVDSSRRVLDSVLVQFTTNNARFDTDFMKHQALSNYYLIAQWLENYPSYREYFIEQEMEPISAEYEKKRHALILNDSNAVLVDSYIDYLEDVVYNAATSYYNAHLDSLQHNRYAYYELRYQAADSTFTLPILKDYFAYSPIADMVEYESPTISDSLFAVFKKQVSTQGFVEELENELAEWKHLTKGNRAPTFSYPSINGDTVSLEDLRGKYVYIDIWATWCGPCLAEIPDLKRLEKKYRYQPVQFVSISIDNSQSAWEYKVKNDNLGGIQLHAEEAWKAQLVKDYKIGGIPRFILIDKEGILIDANASRPSGTIETQLDKLL